MKDLVVTWPKTRSLESYLAECERAVAAGLVINYHIHAKPELPSPDVRVYVVHDGAVRGWQQLISVEERGSREVRDPEGGWWPPGLYLVRDPAWHPIDSFIPMRGFQGWRYMVRP